MQPEDPAGSGWDSMHQWPCPFGKMPAWCQMQKLHAMCQFSDAAYSPEIVGASADWPILILMASKHWQVA